MKELYYRQREINDTKIILVIPQKSSYPNTFCFHYIDVQDLQKYIDIGIVDTGMHKFELKQGVIGLFHTLYIGESEFIRAFSSNKFIDIIAAINIGEKLPVTFRTDFDQVLGIVKSIFPIKDYSKCYYGKLRYYVDESFVKNTGFHIISSYEEPFDDSNKADRRIFMGFRVYGIKGNNSLVWRNTLSISMQYFQKENWHLSLLHTAISIESFIDILFQRILGDLNEDLLEHIIKNCEKKEKLLAINNKLLKSQFSKSKINKIYNELNEVIFSIRNKIAHGKIHYQDVNKDQAFSAIIQAIDFIWDFDIDSRKDLVTFYPMNKIENMIDDTLIEECKKEAKNRKNFV